MSESARLAAADVAAACEGAALRVAVAESCTGGMVAAALTGVPGASRWFRGGVVSYATEIKRTVLGVSEADLDRTGPVDPDVARQMAEGARRELGADVAVSTTGLAGPDGDGVHPVGTVYIGWASVAGSGAEAFRFTGDRAAVREQTVEAALRALVRTMREGAVEGCVPCGSAN